MTTAPYTLCIFVPQLELSYYRLEMVPGYRHQYEDCMVCGYTGTVQYSTVQYSTWRPDYNSSVCAGGPLLLRTASLASLDPALPRDLALLDLGLRTRHTALQLACPGSTQYSAQCPH